MVTTTPLEDYTSLTGTGIFPNPIRYAFDGKVAVALKILNAAADNLDALEVLGIAAVTTPVAATAGDEAATAADIAAAAAAGYFANSHLSMVAISSDIPQRGYGAGSVRYGFSTVSFDGATTFIAVETPLVIQEWGGTTDGTYRMMDAAFPGPSPTSNPTAQECLIDRPYTVGVDSWIYIPELETFHKVLRRDIAGGGGFSPSWNTHFAILLDPVPATVPGELYAVLPLPPMNTTVVVTNSGGATATVDGQALAAGRSVSFVRRTSPIKWNATGTLLDFTFDGEA